MRLKLLTNLNTLLLVTVCVALAATLWWSQRALQQPVQLMERYLTLSQQFQREVADNIQAYLAGGNAVQHSSATQAIDAFDEALEQLPPETKSIAEKVQILQSATIGHLEETVESGDVKKLAKALETAQSTYQSMLALRSIENQVS